MASLEEMKIPFPRWTFIFLWAAFGWVISQSEMLSPLHEIWHVRASERQGIPARVTGPRSGEIDEFSSEAMWAGYGMELIYAISLSIAGALIGRFAFPILSGGFGLGYAASVYGRGLVSWDLNGLPKSYIFDNYPDKAERLWAEIGPRILQAWTVRCALLIGIALVVTGLCVWEKKKPSKARA